MNTGKVLRCPKLFEHDLSKGELQMVWVHANKNIFPFFIFGGPMSDRRQPSPCWMAKPEGFHRSDALTLKTADGVSALS